MTRESTFDFYRTKARWHWRWARSEGLDRLIEEDDLRPFVRSRNALRNWRWRRVNGVRPGEAVPVYVVGVQRSGTNMLLRGLQALPEFEIHNENDGRAFHRYRLHSGPRIADLVTSSRHRFVLFKPLCDSHRVDLLLDNLDAPAGRAIWAYRGVDGRVRSAIAKFSDTNLRVLEKIAAGKGDELWQAQRLSAESLELIRSFDYSSMTPESAAALFWYARNVLYFELGLAERRDVMLSSYDALLAHPTQSMSSLCGFLGLSWNSRLVVHIQARTETAQPPLPIDPRIRDYCDTLQARLDTAAARDRTAYARQLADPARLACADTEPRGCRG